jgi:plastocyanin
MRYTHWRWTAVLAAAFPVLAAFTPRGRPAAPPPAVHDVRMVMEGTTPRFVPAALTIRPGDRVRFTVVSGGPHNVSFDTSNVSAGARRVLAAAMPNQIQPLWGPLLTNAGESYTISFAGVKPGRYEFFCMPHMAMGMRGVVTVQ